MKCQVCGKEIDKSKYSNGIICSPECFERNFWLEKIRNKDQYIIVNNEIYAIGEEDSKSIFRGFGGANYIIKFFDGAEVSTTNLWYCGEIPEEFRDQLPDNAVFIK